MSKIYNRDKLENIKKNLELNFTKSIELYQKCIEEDQDGLIIQPPIKWLYDQDMMRNNWSKFKNTKDAEFLTSSYRKYASFMYNSYPEGFGNIISQKIKDVVYVNEAEVFYDLTEDIKLITNKCFSCYKEVYNIKVCSVCHIAKYCSKECQTKDWIFHRVSCNIKLEKYEEPLNVSGSLGTISKPLEIDKNVEVPEIQNLS